MKFSGSVLNGIRNEWLHFGSDLDHSGSSGSTFGGGLRSLSALVRI